MNQRIKNIAVSGAAFATGVAGTAVAGQLATGGDFKDGSIKSKDLARSVREQLDQGKPRGQQGPQGPPGLQGPPGAAGAQGTVQGPPAITALLRGGTIQGQVVNPGSPNFHAVIGGNGGSEAGVQIPAPAGVVSAGNLRVRQNATPAAAVTFTLRVNGLSTAVACTLTPAQPTCESAVPSAPIATGDLLSLGVSSAGSNITYTGAFSLELNLGS